MRAWRSGCLGMLAFWLAACLAPGQAGAPTEPPPPPPPEAAPSAAATGPPTPAAPRLRVTPAPGRLRLVEFYSAT